MPEKSVDDLIRDALETEEQALFENEPEPGYFKQAIGLFRGPLGWVIWLVYVWQILTGAGAVYALWRLFGASDPVMAVKWGVAAILLALFAVTVKNFMGAHLEANRVLREIKRIELRVALLNGDRERADRE